MTTVLVAGGTGMLGSRIADCLVKETGVQVRLLVRDGWEDHDAKRQRVDLLVTQGATVAIDLFHAPSGPPQFDVRLQADAAIDALDLEVIHILNGGFMGIPPGVANERVNG